MVTFAQRWLIRRGYYHLAEEEYEKYILSMGGVDPVFSELFKGSDDYLPISIAFVWSKTKQNFFFWNKVNEEYYNDLAKWKYTIK